MKEPKILVLSLQPTYAWVRVNGKEYAERFDCPQTKEQVKSRILERLAAEKSETSRAAEQDRDASSPGSEPKPENGSDKKKKDR